MNCQEVQHIITITPPQQWSAEVRAHINQCTTCSIYAQLQDFPNQLTSVNLFPSIDMTAPILSTIQRHQRNQKRWLVISVAASLLIGFLLGIILTYYIHQHDNTQQLSTYFDNHYQYTDVFFSDLYDVNNFDHE